MKDFILFVVKSIVDNPDQVSVEEITDDNFVNLNVIVDPSDMGKVIGKNGKIIKSLRILLRVLSIKEGKRAVLNLVDNNPIDNAPPELAESVNE